MRVSYSVALYEYDFRFNNLGITDHDMVAISLCSMYGGGYYRHFKKVYTCGYKTTAHFPWFKTKMIFFDSSAKPLKMNLPLTDDIMRVKNVAMFDVSNYSVHSYKRGKGMVDGSLFILVSNECDYPTYSHVVGLYRRYLLFEYDT
jgi:hypothetical protein